MSEFAERLRAIEVRVTSPDGTVTLDVDGAGRLKVVLAEGHLRGHTERTLEQEVNAVIRGAFRGLRRGYVQARRASFPASDPDRS